MTRTIPVAALVTLAASLLMVGQEKAQQAGQRRNAEQKLVQLEGEIAQAMTRGDFDFLESVLADDFIGVNPLGEELTKAEVLARLRSPDYGLESLQHENIRARVFGDCAVMLARAVVKGRYRGEEAGGEFPYLRVWLRREGRWQAVAAQSTSLPSQ